MPVPQTASEIGKGGNPCFELRAFEQEPKGKSGCLFQGSGIPGAYAAGAGPRTSLPTYFQFKRQPRHRDR